MVFHIMAHHMNIPQKEHMMVGEKHIPFFHETIDPIEGQNKVYVTSSSLPFTGVTKLNPKTQKLTFGGTYNKMMKK